jgi:hypothetical protein
MIDKKTRKLLEEKFRILHPDWLETGKKELREKFFGFFSKKQMSLVLLLILLLVIVADAAIFYLLHISNL